MILRTLGRISMSALKTSNLRIRVSFGVKYRSCIEGTKCLINDALNTFYLRLYGVRHIEKDPLSVRGNPLPPHGLLSD